MSFNPTLVRLRQEHNKGESRDHKSVSIPRWFD